MSPTTRASESARRAEQPPTGPARAPRTTRRRATGRPQTVLAVLLLTAATSVLAPAAAQAATEVHRATFRGFFVEGSTTVVGECAFTTTSIIAERNRVDYRHYTYDFCTGASTFVSGEAAPSTFDVRPNLSEAHVVATVPLVDDVSGPAGQVLIDNTWTATGPSVRSSSSRTETLPGGYHLSERSRGSAAPATVTGTVLLESGTIRKSSYLAIIVARD